MVSVTLRRTDTRYSVFGRIVKLPYSVQPYIEATVECAAFIDLK